MSAVIGLFWAAVSSLGACGEVAPAPEAPAPEAHAPSTVEAPLVAPDPFAEWLAASHPVADGFSPARSKTGEMRAIAAGRVLSAQEAEGGDVVVVEHLFYENHVRCAIRSRLGPLSGVEVVAGQTVVRGQRLGRGPTARLTLETDAPPPDELRGSLHDPAAFIRAHADLFVPQAERVLALVSHSRQRMRIYEEGAAVGEYEVGFGQEPGRKERRGDNRTPMGMYFVVARSTGPFEGPFADYYGGHWIKLDYPNLYDGERGLAEGLVDARQQRAIASAWRHRQATPGQTRLGGGIGFHGWAHEWSDLGDRRMSWGCVVLHLRDVAAVYARLEVGTMVVIF